MPKIIFQHTYDNIISLENLLGAWKEFVRGKRARKDVQEFERNLMANIISLHCELAGGTYRHGIYEHFKISDPKPRDIHKASVRDRLVHHAVYRVLYFFYHPVFIADSFSCRLTKGTHKALDRFRAFAYQVSQNHTKTCWVLQGDIKKFFACIDHQILFQILRQRIADRRILNLVGEIVNSFYSTAPGKGLPLGNLTSQLLVNIYMDQFDQFVKHELKVKHYLRYADDFAILSPDQQPLKSLVPYMELFLKERLRLALHPSKVFIRTLASGVDWLGWVHFPDHRVLRTSTKRRMFATIKRDSRPAVLNSYLGLLEHGNAAKLKSVLK